MNTYQPHSMLVTGGAGFIGANFIRYVLTHRPAIQIINIDKLTYAGSLENLQHLPRTANYHFVQGDIIDRELIESIFKSHDIDTVVHFAAESHVDRSIAGPAAFIETNIQGTFTLLETAREEWLNRKKYSSTACRFHHISTDEVFGSLAFDAPSFTETSRYLPRSPYSASKAAADHLVHAYYHTYGLPMTLSNCSNNYGPYQHKEKFIPTVIAACLNEQPIPIYGLGKNIRDWLYVEDHCRGILRILEQGQVGESYGLGGNNEWENLTLARYICDKFDVLKPLSRPYAELITSVTDRAGHDFRYAINTTKIKEHLQWTPLESFSTGIDKTIQYYLQFLRSDRMTCHDLRKQYS